MQTPLTEQRNGAEAYTGQHTGGLSGSTVKLIAMAAMLIDHTAASVLERWMQAQGMAVYIINLDRGALSVLSVVYGAMRLIGRLAFPIFIFLLVEGFQYTRNRWKYLLRLILFAAVSEIPFDMAFHLSGTEIRAGRLLEFGYQNVFFTLAIGLLTIMGIDALIKSSLPKTVRFLAACAVLCAGMALAYLLRTDYGAVGVLAITVMYLWRNRRLLGAGLTCCALLASSIVELAAFLALIPIGQYNGTRGLRLKWAFYLFYPVHLALLALICLATGI